MNKFTEWVIAIMLVVMMLAWTFSMLTPFFNHATRIKTLETQVGQMLPVVQNLYNKSMQPKPKK